MTKPCGDCAKFDQKTTGSTKGEKPAKFGWCSATSTYSESDTLRPDGVKTTTGRPVPVIRLLTTVVPNCIHFKEK
jgi:hypothetical protein